MIQETCNNFEMAKSTKAEAGNEVKKWVNITILRSVRDELKVVGARKPIDRSLNELSTKVLQWFVEQKPPIQSAVLGGGAPGMEDKHADVVEEIARQIRSGGKVVPVPKKIYDENRDPTLLKNSTKHRTDRDTIDQ